MNSITHVGLLLVLTELLVRMPLSTLTSAYVNQVSTALNVSNSTDASVRLAPTVQRASILLLPEVTSAHARRATPVRSVRFFLRVRVRVHSVSAMADSVRRRARGISAPVLPDTTEQIAEVSILALRDHVRTGVLVSIYPA